MTDIVEQLRDRSDHYIAQHAMDTMDAAATAIERLRAALTEARDAWQEQLDCDIAASCPTKRDGTPDLDQMDEEQRPMIEETRAFVARLSAALGDEQTMTRKTGE